MTSNGFRSGGRSTTPGFYVIRDGQQVAIGETGELCIAGVGLARGYLNNAALTARKVHRQSRQPR